MPVFNPPPFTMSQNDRPIGPTPGSDRPFLYTLSTCIHCKHAKELFKRLEVSYDFIDVDKLSEEESSVLEEMGKYNPKETFPTIIIGSTVIIGYQENDIKKALGR